MIYPRFKTKDTAEDFKATFEACQAKVGDKSISEGSQSTAGGSLSTARGSQSTEVKEGVSQESTGSTWKDTNVSQQVSLFLINSKCLKNPLIRNFEESSKL